MMRLCKRLWRMLKFDVMWFHSIVSLIESPLILCIVDWLIRTFEETPLNHPLALCHNLNSTWDIEIQTTEMQNSMKYSFCVKWKLLLQEQLTISPVMPRTTQLSRHFVKISLKSSSACMQMPLIHLGNSSIRFWIKLSSAPGHRAGVGYNSCSDLLR